MTKKDLQREVGISWASVTKMLKDEVVGAEILMKVCRTLYCGIGDIVEFIVGDKMGHNDSLSPFFRTIYDIRYI